MATLSQAPQSAHPGDRRMSPMLASLLVGIPVGLAVLSLFHEGEGVHGPLAGSTFARYLHHPVECVEVVMFCCALTGLAFKLWRNRTERRALAQEILPRWGGAAVPVSASRDFQARVDRLPGWVRSSVIGQRARAVLEFVSSRGAATELDDQLRALSDVDSMTLEQSYSLVRFITWAIPILGFLGTVLGITGAIAGVTPERLEHNLSAVTDGLSLAFDATALGLGLTMITMFATFLVERAEAAVLEAVDRYADRELAHRFERSGTDSAPFVELVRRQTDILIETCEQLVKKQADVWASSFGESERLRLEAEHRQRTATQEQHERMIAALESALNRTLEAHTTRLRQLEQASAESHARTQNLLGHLATLGDRVSAQAETISRLQAGEEQLVRLQESLDRNLALVNGSGNFEEAVHSLSAAVHLLTARAGGLSVRDPQRDAARDANRPGHRPSLPGGAAA